MIQLHLRHAPYPSLHKGCLRIRVDGTALLDLPYGQQRTLSLPDHAQILQAELGPHKSHELWLSGFYSNTLLEFRLPWLYWLRSQSPLIVQQRLHDAHGHDL